MPKLPTSLTANSPTVKVTNPAQTERFASMVSTLVREYKIPTPFLMIDEAEVLRSLGYFQTYMPKVRLFYAMKANSSLELLRWMASQGLSFDVSSAGEISLLNSLGVDSEKLYLSTPIKNQSTIEALFDRGVNGCAIDSIQELERLANYHRDHPTLRVPKIFVRIRIESKNVEVDLNTKFGCTLADALEVLRMTHELQFPIGGMCFHVGTHSTSADNYFLGIESAMLVAKEARRRYGFEVPVINIGGGFSDPYTAAKAGIDLDAFYRSIGEACQQAIDAGFEVYAEPGRCLVSGAGVAVSEVLGITERSGKQWTYLDDGIYGCYSIKLYENHDFQFQALRDPRKKAFALSKSERPWTVAGPTCDSLDVISTEVSLPENLAVGDIMITPNLGAYTISTASCFNGFELPTCYVARKDETSASGKTEIVSLWKLSNAPAVGGVAA